MISELIVSVLRLLPMLLVGLALYRIARVWFCNAPPLEGDSDAKEE